MNKAKYIIIELELIETPIVFPLWLNHLDVARGLGDTAPLLSAGFLTVIQSLKPGSSMPEIEVDCFGRSETLKLDSKEGDSRLVARALGIGD